MLIPSTLSKGDAGSPGKSVLVSFPPWHNNKQPTGFTQRSVIISPPSFPDIGIVVVASFRDSSRSHAWVRLAGAMIAELKLVH
jgi:hypothetical protein